MGQLINRLKFFIKSQFQNDEPHKFYETFDLDGDLDKELKRTIEDLANSKINNNEYEAKTEQMNLEIAYRILGLEGKPTIEDIKLAYKKRLKEYHPDLVSNLGENLQTLAKKKTQEIISAYHFLKMFHNF
ncbi:MAG: J domain-containing protein [Candidatus Kapaibacteriales bacterium]